MGSPPPTRGTLFFSCFARHLPGITPAYAGNTILFLLCSSFARDHPRLRGEHYTRESNLSHVTGSPPPTRGTLFNTIIGNTGCRITPAYTGNTLFKLYTLSVYRDHPRLRREHFTCLQKFSRYLGSPPPTQGTPIINGETRYRDRITPSYAGNTLIGGKLDRAFRDHPRLRREHYLRYFEM